MSTANFKDSRASQSQRIAELNDTCRWAFVAQLLADVANRINRVKIAASRLEVALAKRRAVSTRGARTGLPTSSKHRVTKLMITPTHRDTCCDRMDAAALLGLQAMTALHVPQAVGRADHLCHASPAAVHVHWLCTSSVADHLVGRYDETRDLRPLL